VYLLWTVTDENIKVATRFYWTKVQGSNQHVNFFIFICFFDEDVVNLQLNCYFQQFQKIKQKSFVAASSILAVVTQTVATRKNQASETANPFKKYLLAKLSNIENK
jgi:hypothetical protein